MRYVNIDNMFFLLLKDTHLFLVYNCDLRIIDLYDGMNFRYKPFYYGTDWNQRCCVAGTN